ncbi:MAG TPA: hypothetical protein VFV72_05025 [Candidatus Limnocylindrales bacterium]|nr:hypothetical protein [Candidatus Limnocylindrales bacterium]
MTRPIGVTVVAIVMAVLGVFTLLLGLEGTGITNFGLKQLAPQGGLYANTVIISGILTLIASFGLFTLAKWAWYLAVIVLIIRVVADVFGLISSGLSNTYGSVTIASAAITIFFLWYFLRPNVRAAFGTEKAL